MYLAKQSDKPFQSLLALYLVVEDPQSGVTIKLPGRLTATPSHSGDPMANVAGLAP